MTVIVATLAVTAFVTGQPPRSTVFATVAGAARDSHGRTVVNAVIPCDGGRCQKHAGEVLTGVIRSEPDGTVVLHWFSRKDQYGCHRPIPAPDVRLQSADATDLIGATMPLPGSAFPEPIDSMKCSLADIDAR